MEYGKCLINNQSKTLKECNIFENIPIEHAEDCPFDLIYTNKTEFELQQLQKFFENLREIKNHKVKFASVGILADKDVYRFILKIEQCFNY